MASVREWQFKRKFRDSAYGWRASSFAIGSLKEAAAEIRSVAKSDPVRLMCFVICHDTLSARIWALLRYLTPWTRERVECLPQNLPRRSP